MPMTTPMTTPTILETDLASRLRFTVMRLARRLRQTGDGDATLSQLSALSSIDHRGPLTLGELAAVERVAPPSMTRIVSRLEERGLVSREVDAADRRVARVRTTAEGKRMLERSRNKKTAYLAARIDKLSDNERGLLQQALPVIERLMGDIDK